MPAYAPTQWTIDFQSESQLAMYWDEQAFLSQYSEFTTSTTPTERPGKFSLKERADKNMNRVQKKRQPSSEFAVIFLSSSEQGPYHGTESG